MQISYIINQYPKVSHTFIRREILALERKGHHVQRIALRGWRDTMLDPDDIAEQEKTQYVLQTGLVLLLCIAVKVLVKTPLLFMRALWQATVLGLHADRPLVLHWMYFLEACQVSQWLINHKSEHIHAHFGTNSTEIALLANTLSHVPYSFTVHGPEEFDKPQFLKLKEKIAQAKFVVAISSFGRSQLMRWTDSISWSKIKVVHCGLESGFYQDQQQEIPQALRMVCVGRICEQKGQLLLVEAAKLLRDEGLSFELILAGDGEMRAEVEALIQRYDLSRYVEITGWISSEQVRDYILTSRALVLPSFAEGLPVVIMEAMSLKRPVISTYIAGIPELVQHRENGWLIPAGCVVSIKQAMMEMLNTSDSRLEEMGLSAYRRVIERHAIDTEVDKLIAHMEA